MVSCVHDAAFHPLSDQIDTRGAGHKCNLSPLTSYVGLQLMGSSCGDWRRSGVCRSKAILGEISLACIDQSHRQPKLFNVVALSVAH